MQASSPSLSAPSSTLSPILSPSSEATLAWFLKQGVSATLAKEALHAVNFDFERAQSWIIAKQEDADQANGMVEGVMDEELYKIAQDNSLKQRKEDRMRETRERAQLVGEDPLAAYANSTFLNQMLKSAEVDGRQLSYQLAKAAHPTLNRLLHLEEQCNLWYPFSRVDLAVFFKTLAEDFTSVVSNSKSAELSKTSNAASSTSSKIAPSGTLPTTSKDKWETDPPGLKAGVALLASKVEEMNSTLINGNCDQSCGGLPKMFRLSTVPEVYDLTDD
mmetsp:Transcript_2622/g.3585  ORF Transcript_2622/g.3585 Transcript_2622/m.3585 type:complete len:275 (+) Transcript_2622:186-1010(+)